MVGGGVLGSGGSAIAPMCLILKGLLDLQLKKVSGDSDRHDLGFQWQAGRRGSPLDRGSAPRESESLSSFFL